MSGNRIPTVLPKREKMVVSAHPPSLPRQHTPPPPDSFFKESALTLYNCQLSFFAIVPLDWLSLPLKTLKLLIWPPFSLMTLTNKLLIYLTFTELCDIVFCFKIAEICMPYFPGDNPTLCCQLFQNRMMTKQEKNGEDKQQLSSTMQSFIKLSQDFWFLTR